MSKAHLTPEQLATAAGLMASGTSVAAAARSVGCSDRHLRRLRQNDPTFQALITSAERKLVRQAHSADRKRALSAGLPAPTPPSAIRQAQEIRALSADELLLLGEAERSGAPISPATARTRAARDPRFAPAIPLELTEEQSADIAYLRFLRTPESEIDEMLVGRRPIPSRHHFRASRGFTQFPDQAVTAQARDPYPDPFASMYGGSDARR